MPVDQQKAVLEEYDERRKYFFGWIHDHFIEGVHYGFPPGCEPKYDNDGWAKDYKGNRVDPRQWKHKPSLYKAGALLAQSLLNIHADYESDMDTWKMAGEPKGLIFRTATIYDVNGKKLGSGTGAGRLTQKAQDENANIKNTDKRALVAAIINGLPVFGDLFTQDLEDMPKPKGMMTIKERKEQLIKDIGTHLAEKGAEFPGSAEDFIKKSFLVLYPNERMNTPGKIDAYLKAVYTGIIDLSTGERK